VRIADRPKPEVPDDSLVDDCEVGGRRTAGDEDDFSGERGNVSLWIEAFEGYHDCDKS